MKSSLAFLLYLTAFPSSFFTQAQSQQDWDQVRDEAESRFEIVKILIKQHKFDQLLAETEKLFAVPFPDKEERRLVESARGICNHLRTAKQIPLAHKVLDQALKAVRRNDSKADLYKEKAYLFRKQGKEDEAMEYFERSLQLINPKK